MKKIALLSALLSAAFFSPSHAQIGIITTVAGTGMPSYSDDGGVATSAMIKQKQSGSLSSTPIPLQSCQQT